MYNKILCSPKLLKNLDKEKVVNRLCFSLAEAKYRRKFITSNLPVIQEKIKKLSKKYLTFKNFKKMSSSDKLKLLLLLLLPSLTMRYKRRKIKWKTK